jgi:hypothetical protein
MNGGATKTLELVPPVLGNTIVNGFVPASRRVKRCARKMTTSPICNGWRNTGDGGTVDCNTCVPREGMGEGEGSDFRSIQFRSHSVISSKFCLSFSKF